MAEIDSTHDIESRKAYVEWMTSAYPKAYTKEDALHSWENGHISALAWQHQAARIAQLEADNASLRGINSDQDKVLAKLEAENKEFKRENSYLQDACAELEAQVLALRDDAERFKSIDRAVSFGIRGPAHGRRFKLVEYNMLTGEEEKVDLLAVAEFARAAKG